MIRSISHRRIRSLIFILIAFTGPSLLAASTSLNELVVVGDGVTAYAGPGLGFRPLVNLSPDQKVPVSSRIVSGKDGEFYKVLITSKFGAKNIGYIAVSEPVKIDESSIVDDIENFRSLSMARSSLQAGFSNHGGEFSGWKIGYLKHPAPSMSISGFVSQLYGRNSTSLILGAESGIDHLLSRSLSVFVAIGFGVLFAPGNDTLFLGSKSTNLFVQPSGGLKVHTDYASVSFGILENAYVNADSNYLTLGFGFTIELGL
jgi:hypothetical protein